MSAVEAPAGKKSPEDRPPQYPAWALGAGYDYPASLTSPNALASTDYPATTPRPVRRGVVRHTGRSGVKAG